MSDQRASHRHCGIALVTGTSSGIGQAVAIELLKRGWMVVGASRRPVSLQHLNYRHLCLDLADPEGLASRVDKELGVLFSDPQVNRLALVNNAADPGLLGPVVRIDPAEMLRIYAINVAAPTWLMGWLTRTGPAGVPRRTVNVSTGAATNAFPGLCAYSNTKAALRMAGMVFSTEINASEGTGTENPDTTILSYEPGTVDTSMQRTARSTPVETLPIVDFFANLQMDGMLVSPSEPAREIADYIENDGHERFTEGRLEPEVT